jgi:hypothetical protein
MPSKAVRRAVVLEQDNGYGRFLEHVIWSSLVKLDNPFRLTNGFEIWTLPILDRSALGALHLMGSLGYDWTQIVTKETAGKIVFVIGLLKTGLYVLCSGIWQGNGSN